MRQLKTGEHFGLKKKSIKMNDLVLTQANQVKNAVVPWHRHETPYFYFHLKGSLLEVNKKESFKCIPGTLLYHESDMPHQNLNFTNKVDFFHIEIKEDWFKKHDIKTELIQGNTCFEDPLLKHNFTKLYNEFLYLDSFSQLAVDGLLLDSFARIHRKKTKPQTNLPTWVKKLNNILKFENITQYSVRSLANQLDLHPAYLSREFPVYFNSKLGDYIRNAKLEKSLYFLSKTTLRNAEIAYKCGFSDESHFIRIFKKKYNLTPFKFRKSIIKSKIYSL